MSKSAPKPAEAGETAEKPKKKGKLLIIIVAAVVLLGGGGGAWFFMKPKPQGKGAHAAKSAQAEKTPSFIELDTFTVNLQPQSQGQFLQTALVAKLKEAAVAEAIKARMPEIKNRVLFVLSSKSAEELSSLQGKQQLGKEITAQIRQVLGDKQQAAQVASVLFTSFVIQ